MNPLTNPADLRPNPSFLEKILFFPRAFLFYLWILISTLLSLPLILFQFGNPKNNQRYGRYYGPIARFILQLKMDVQGHEHWRNQVPCIYVSNHQSFLDMAVFTGVLAPDVVLIGKKELRYLPFWGLMFEAFGNILIDRKNRTHSIAGLKEAVDTIKRRGLSILIFPEGTRQQGSGMLPFKKGAFHMAIEAQVPLQPVLCATQSPYLDLGRMLLRPAILGVEILAPISTKGLTLKDLPVLMEQTRSLMLAGLERANARSHRRV